jgi:hypothetical protein
VGCSQCYHKAEYAEQAPPLDHRGVFSSPAEKLRSCVSRHFSARVQPSCRENCRARPQCWTIAPGSFVSTPLWPGIVKPCFTSFCKIFLVSSGLSCFEHPGEFGLSLVFGEPRGELVVHPFVGHFFKEREASVVSEQVADLSDGSELRIILDRRVHVGGHERLKIVVVFLEEVRIVQ